MKLWDKQDVNYSVLELLHHQTSWVDSQVYLTTRLIYFRIALMISGLKLVPYKLQSLGSLSLGCGLR